MSIYLNSSRQLENFKQLYRKKYMVDKSDIIEKLNEVIETADKYICITRPRRFGKSSVADMLGAYYCKTYDSREIFDNLNISRSDSYLEYINKYNVISISFNKTPENGKTYDDYISMIKERLTEDIKSSYGNLLEGKYVTISDLLMATNEKFIFILDEWDYIFNNNLFVEYQNEFLEFLQNLLKDQPYVALAYMTGVLPIKKYSSTSALNMFEEFTFLKDRIFDEYFGFTEEEVRKLCGKNEKVSFEELQDWYNGYITPNGIKIYNPRSVCIALNRGYCESYWTNTGAMDEIQQYLEYNTLEVREDVIEMVSGSQIDIIINEEFRAGQETPRTKEEIYSAMIVLGFLSYYDGYLKIPNKELMKEFEKALRIKSFGYVSEIIENSKRMLRATVNKECKIVEKVLHDIHNSEIPIFQYNDENSLSCVLTLAYLSARDTYRVEREEKTGKGYADFTFHPRRKNDIPFVVELKKNQPPDVAIRQIREKEYIEKFKKENKDRKVLAVAICYDSINKEHSCIIEEI